MTLNVTLFIQYRLNQKMAGLLTDSQVSVGMQRMVAHRKRERIAQEQLPCLIQLLNLSTGQLKQRPADLCTDCCASLEKHLRHTKYMLIHYYIKPVN